MTHKPGSDKGKFNPFYSVIISSDESFEQAGSPQGRQAIGNSVCHLF